MSNRRIILFFINWFDKGGSRRNVLDDNLHVVSRCYEWSSRHIPVNIQPSSTMSVCGSRTQTCHRNIKMLGCMEVCLWRESILTVRLYVVDSMSLCSALWFYNIGTKNLHFRKFNAEFSEFLQALWDWRWGVSEVNSDRYYCYNSYECAEESTLKDINIQ